MLDPKLILVCGLVLVTAGCVWKGKPKVVTAATPPAPKPVVQPAAPPPPEPLSIPQTQVQLPFPQPVTEDAIATIQAQPVDLPEPPAAKPARRLPLTPAPTLTKPDTIAAPGQTGAPAGQTSEPPRAPIHELLTPQEQKALADSVEVRRREIGLNLSRLRGRRTNRAIQDLIARIESFRKQSEEAVARGDMRQADALAERAQVLSRELQSGR